MTEQEILARLTRIIRNVLDNDDIILSGQVSANDIDHWDSVAHVRIMISIEEEWGIRFEIDELSSLPDVGTLIAIIEQKLSAK